MRIDDLNRLSASTLARRIAEGATSAEAAVQACLARIADREPQVRAWAFIDAELALEQARARDQTEPIGPLHGVPIGVKDIIDTFDMPTAMGSPIYRGHRTRGDAACVALARNAGAVILGKTVTAEFASMSPGPTTNPHDRTHTPGGSSSGSAAAVADFMTPLAFGTQTGGSVLRPSSYCGIIGFKPTFGTFNLGGVKPAGQSLDTLGLHARTVEDIALLTSVLIGRPPAPLAVPDRPPVIGFCRTPLWEHALPETVAALEDARIRLTAAGVEMREVVLPPAFDHLEDSRATIAAYERSRLMTWEWTRHREQIGSLLQAEIEKGLAVSYAAYCEALERAERCRSMTGSVMDGLDALLAPAVDGAAPPGIASTGNARFQGIWTVARLPSITLPTHSAPNGLPVGIQLVGGYREDERLLCVAEWVFDALGPWRDQ